MTETDEPSDQPTINQSASFGLSTEQIASSLSSVDRLIAYEKANKLGVWADNPPYQAQLEAERAAIRADEINMGCRNTAGRWTYPYAESNAGEAAITVAEEIEDKIRTEVPPMYRQRLEQRADISLRRAGEDLREIGYFSIADSMDKIANTLATIGTNRVADE